MKLSLEERFRIWRHSKNDCCTGYYGYTTLGYEASREMEFTFIVEGINAAPLFAEYVRESKRPSPLSWGSHPATGRDALNVLGDMDRFVPQEQFLLPAVRAGIAVIGSGTGGQINPVAPVDGHRIGKQAYEAIRWAGEQTEHKELQFEARVLTGQLKLELENLPMEEQLRRWQESARRSNDVRVVGTGRILKTILSERMLDTIPGLLKAFERGGSQMERWNAIDLFSEADGCRLRLRGTEAGRRAIETIRAYLTKERGVTLQRMMGRFLRDEDSEPPYFSRWGLYAYALEFIYGDDTAKNFDPKQIGASKPEFRQFITYLTEKDPYFPSWEYVACGGQVEDEVFQPRFKAKMERYHQAWLQFQAQKQSPGIH